MTLLAVERIKLFSTRSPWWCMALAVGLTVGITAIIAANFNDFPMPILATQFTFTLGLYVIMVMAALAVTTEYRFGTIRSTFLAVPRRTSALLAKTAVVTLLALVVGEATAFGSFGISRLLADDTSQLVINSANDWRQTAGVGLVYAAGAIMAVAVGILVRHTAGAVAIILVFALVIESLVILIPNIGDDIQKWMPFTVANNFIFMNSDPGGLPAEGGPPVLDAPLGVWGSYGYFAGIGVALLIVALIVAKRRDA